METIREKLLAREGSIRKPKDYVNEKWIFYNRHRWISGMVKLDMADGKYSFFKIPPDIPMEKGEIREEEKEIFSLSMGWIDKNIDFLFEIKEREG
jgi:hypothetical protein